MAAETAFEQSGSHQAPAATDNGTVSGNSTESGDGTESGFTAPERTAAGGTSPQWLASGTPGTGSPSSKEPSRILTPAESALMARSSSTASQNSAPNGGSGPANPFLTLPGASSDATPGAMPGEEGPPTPGPRRDISMLDPDLQQLLESRRSLSNDNSTPVGITVFLDEQHMTVGQRPAVFLTNETGSEALASLLTGINEEVSLARRRPREPLLPIVKFVVSPGGERWRILFARELKTIGIPSAQIYSIDPYIIPIDDTGRATVPALETASDEELTRAESSRNGEAIQ